MSTVTLNEFGKADWTDYVDYWRDDDAEWIQSRTILRYADDTARGSTGERGQVVFNNALDILQLRSKDGTWKNYGPMPYNMLPSTDTATGVGLKHKDAPGGVLFTSPTGTPPSVLLAQVPLHSVNSAVILDSTGITFKTGVPLAKLTWDGTTLSLDSPVSVPNLTVKAGGVLTTPSLSATGPVTVAGLLTASGDLSVTGKATVGTVGSNISGVTFADQSITAAKGIHSLGGVHYGTASSARMAAGTFAAPGASYVDVTATDVVLHATNINLDGQPFIVAKAVNYRPTLGGTNYPIVPSFYAAADPGVANFPDGTIWIS